MAREMAQQLRARVALAEDPSSLLTQWLTTILNSSSRAPNTSNNTRDICGSHLYKKDEENNTEGRHWSHTPVITTLGK